MKFNIELIGSSFYYTINRVAMKLFEVLSLWLLVFLLPKEDIGMIGIAVGFIAILNLLNLSPYRRIYKSFNDLKPRMNDHLSAYLGFWFLKSILMLLVSAGAGLFYIHSGYPWEFFVILMVLASAYFFTNLQLLLQEVFFVNLKQKIVTKFNIASMAVFLLSLGLLLAFPGVEVYALLVMLKALLTCAGFLLISKKEVGFFFSLPKDWIALLKDAMKEFAVYDHLIGAAIELVNKVFLFIMGFFVAQAIVGDYTIALSLVNFLTFFPLIIYRTAMLAITRAQEKESLEKVLSAFTKYSVVFSILQFAVFAFALEPIIMFATSGNAGNIWNYAILLGLGVSVFSAGHPIHAVALLRGKIEGYFFGIILPVTAAALIGYYIASSSFASPEAIGVVFVLASVLMNALAYLHVRRHAGVKVRKVLMYPEEREAIDFVLAKIGVKQGKGT